MGLLRARSRKERKSIAINRHRRGEIRPSSYSIHLEGNPNKLKTYKTCFAIAIKNCLKAEVKVLSRKQELEGASRKLPLSVERQPGILGG
jgi:hypothetical protein